MVGFCWTAHRNDLVDGEDSTLPRIGSISRTNEKYLITDQKISLEDGRSTASQVADHESEYSD